MRVFFVDGDIWLMRILDKTRKYGNPEKTLVVEAGEGYTYSTAKAEFALERNDDIITNCHFDDDMSHKSLPTNVDYMLFDRLTNCCKTGEEQQKMFAEYNEWYHYRWNILWDICRQQATITIVQ